MSIFFDRVAFLTPTTGTGTVEVDEAITAAFFTPDEAGVSDATSAIPYLILDGTDVEFGYGTYNSGPPANFSRDTVTKSKINGVVGTDKIDLSGNARVRFTLTAADLLKFPSAADAFVNDERLLRADGNGRGVQASGIAVDDNGRMTGHGNMAWQAATEGSGEIIWDCQNGALLNWHVEATDTAEIQAPVNLPDGWTCLLELDPNGQTISWAADYREDTPEPTGKAIIAIIRRGSEYIAVVSHEEAE